MEKQIQDYLINFFFSLLDVCNSKPYPFVQECRENLFELTQCSNICRWCVSCAMSASLDLVGGGKIKPSTRRRYTEKGYIAQWELFGLQPIGLSVFARYPVLSNQNSLGLYTTIESKLFGVIRSKSLTFFYSFNFRHLFNLIKILCNNLQSLFLCFISTFSNGLTPTNQRTLKGRQNSFFTKHSVSNPQSGQQDRANQNFWQTGSSTLLRKV